MTAVSLRLIDPETNRARYYHLDIQPDLFGNWCLVREWGRVGCAGKVLSRAYPNIAEAERALGRQQRHKERRGYRFHAWAVELQHQRQHEPPVSADCYPAR